MNTLQWLLPNIRYTVWKTKQKRKLNSNNYIQFYIATTEKTWC